MLEWSHWEYAQFLLEKGWAATPWPGGRKAPAPLQFDKNPAGDIIIAPVEWYFKVRQSTVPLKYLAAMAFCSVHRQALHALGIESVGHMHTARWYGVLIEVALGEKPVAALADAEQPMSFAEERAVVAAPRRHGQARGRAARPLRALPGPAAALGALPAPAAAEGALDDEEYEDEDDVPHLALEDSDGTGDDGGDLGGPPTPVGGCDDGEPIDGSGGDEDEDWGGDGDAPDAAPAPETPPDLPPPAAPPTPEPPGVPPGPPERAVGARAVHPKTHHWGSALLTYRPISISTGGRVVNPSWQVACRLAEHNVVGAARCTRTITCRDEDWTIVSC